MDEYKEALNKFNDNDYESAYALFLEGSKKKDPKCLYMLGVMHILGYYVQEDCDAAFHYMEEALPGLIELANGGDIESIGMMADYYSDQDNPKKDFQKAFEACDRTKGAETAPAHGLYFVQVKY